MTTNQRLITDILTEALLPGPMGRPETILSVLNAENSPFEALMHIEDANAINMAIEQDFGPLHSLHGPSGAVNSKLKDQWTTLFRWLLFRLKSWKKVDDVRMGEFAALLLTSKLCGGQTNIWPLTPREYTPSADFITTLSTSIARLQIAYNSHGSTIPPIWENEFIETFRKADEAGDWTAIADMWPQFKHTIRANFLFTEMVRCLAHYAFDELVNATNCVKQCPLAMKIAHVLSTEQRLRLASETKSRHIQFCFIFHTVTRNYDSKKITHNDENTLSQLLINIATSPDEWNKWVKTYNKYPLRYPNIHRALGNALANTSYETAMTYINSIDLHPINAADHNESITLINECLQCFCLHAPHEHRRAVLAYAHRRWRNWSFNTNAHASYLFEVSKSQLDYAVISYASECISKSDLENILTDIQRQMLEVELIWHKDESECVTEFNRLLSIYQPYAHAFIMSTNFANTSSDTKIYYPFNPSKSLYQSIMFRLRTHHMPI